MCKKLIEFEHNEYNRLRQKQFTDNFPLHLKLRTL